MKIEKADFSIFKISLFWCAPPPHCPSRGQWAGLTILARLCAAGGPTHHVPCPPAWWVGAR